MKKSLIILAIFFIFFDISCTLAEISSEISSESKKNSFLTSEDRLLVKLLKQRLKEEYEYNQGTEKEKDEIFKWTDFYVDGYIFNWILYNDRDLDKTESAVLKSIKWRIKNNLHLVKDYIPPQYIIDNYQYNITGFTKDEALPVVYIPGGKWDVVEGLRHGYRKDMIKMLLHMIEKVVTQVHDDYYKNILSVEPSGQFIGICDMDGLELKQVTSIRVIGMLATTMQFLEANWPFSHRELVAINAPGIFTILLDLAKRVLSEKTFGRIFVYDHDKSKWEPHLKKLISEPKLYPREIL